MIRPLGPMQQRQYQAAAPQIQQQQPGMTQQLAQSAAKKYAGDQVAKLGLQAAGTAAAGPLGGAIAGAGSDMLAPLAGQLVGNLFNKGGPVYLEGGGDAMSSWDSVYNGSEQDLKDWIKKYDVDPTTAYEAWDNEGEFDTIKFNEKKPVTPETPVVEDVVEAPLAAPTPRPQGGKSSGSGKWNNIPLGNLGGWDLTTSGGVQGDTRMNDGTKTDGGWNASVNASKASSFLDNLFGGNSSAQIAQSAAMADERGKNLQMNDSAYWRAQGMTDEDAIMDKVLEHMESGGPVKDKKKKSIWGSIKDKVSKDFQRRDALFGKGKLPQYKEMGGMTSGPLGMSDMQEIGKSKDISKVVMKKKNKDIEDMVELNYHAPLSFQKPTNTGE